MPTKEAVRVSPFCHGNEVSAEKSHTMEWYRAKENVNQKEIDRLLENKVIQECPLCHGDRVYSAMAHSINGYRHNGHTK